MTLTPYKKALAMAKEKIDEVLAIPRANKVRKEGELKIAELDEQIATQETKIQELCMQYPICYDHLIDALDDLELQEARKDRLQDIINQMFEK